jgi:hypothetical protein
MDALREGQTPKDFRDVKARWYILEMMDNCWAFDPQERPNFKKILQDLEYHIDIQPTNAY